MFQCSFIKYVINSYCTVGWVLSACWVCSTWWALPDASDLRFKRFHILCCHCTLVQNIRWGPIPIITNHGEWIFGTDIQLQKKWKSLWEFRVNFEYNSLKYCSWVQFWGTLLEYFLLLLFYSTLHLFDYISFDYITHYFADSDYSVIMRY